MKMAINQPLLLEI